LGYLQTNSIPEILSVKQWNNITSELSIITGLPKEDFYPGIPFGVPKGTIKKNEI
jgi:hypothetical protein